LLRFGALRRITTSEGSSTPRVSNPPLTTFLSPLQLAVTARSSLPAAPHALFERA
jgi:hypothetical protein